MSCLVLSHAVAATLLSAGISVLPQPRPSNSSVSVGHLTWAIFLIAGFGSCRCLLKVMTALQSFMLSLEWLTKPAPNGTVWRNSSASEPGRGSELELALQESCGSWSGWWEQSLLLGDFWRMQVEFICMLQL